MTDWNISNDRVAVSGLPKTLYLLMVQGEWQVHTTVNEAQLFHLIRKYANSNAPGERRDLRVFRVDSAKLTRMKYVAEVVREHLEPMGNTSMEEAPDGEA